MFQNLNLRNAVRVAALCAFLASALGPLPAQAQELSLPAPGMRVALSPAFNPPVLKGIKVHPGDPFQLDFILDKGDDASTALETGSARLIKYFLASLTIPEKDLWVNLSPYEKDRIVPENFGQTEMGRDLLAQDYMLKQITASLIYPEGETGKKFWKRIYEGSAKKFHTTDIPVNTFNKVWIVPDKAVVYENAKAGTAYVVESSLKVMLEEDYLASRKNKETPTGLPKAGQNVGASQVIREVILPELEREVNEGRNFAQLRQVYNSLILAAWYKKKIKDSVLNRVYSDRGKTAGVAVDDPQEKQKIYERYLQAFKKGVYNYVKEEIDPATQQAIPRKYFSGGFNMNVGAVLEETHDAAMLAKVTGWVLSVVSVLLRSSAREKAGNVPKVLKPRTLMNMASYDSNTRRTAASNVAFAAPPYGLEATEDLINNFIEPIGIEEARREFGQPTFSADYSRANARAASLFALFNLIARKPWIPQFYRLLAARLEKETKLWLKSNGLNARSEQVYAGTDKELALLEKYKLGHEAVEVSGEFALLENIRLISLAWQRAEELQVRGWLYESVRDIVPSHLLSNAAKEVIFAGDNAMAVQAPAQVLLPKYLMPLASHDSWTRQQAAAAIQLLYTEGSESGYWSRIAQELVDNFIDPAGITQARAEFESIDFVDRLAKKKKDFDPAQARRNARSASLFTLFLRHYMKGEQFSVWMAERLEKETQLWLAKNGTEHVIDGTGEEKALLKASVLGHQAAEVPQEFALVENIRLFLLAQKTYTLAQRKELGLEDWVYKSIDDIVPKDQLTPEARKVVLMQDAAMLSTDALDLARVLSVELDPADPAAVLLAELDRSVVLHHYVQMALKDGLKELKNGHSRIAYAYDPYPHLVFKFKMPSEHSEDLDPNEPVVMAKIAARLGHTVKTVDGVDLIDVDGFTPFMYDNRLRLVQEKVQVLDENDPRVPALMKELKDKLAFRGIHWVAQARNFGLIDGKPVVLDFEDVEIMDGPQAPDVTWADLAQREGFFYKIKDGDRNGAPATKKVSVFSADGQLQSDGVVLAIYPDQKIVSIEWFHPDFIKPADETEKIGRGRALLRELFKALGLGGYYVMTSASDSFRSSLMKMQDIALQDGGRPMRDVIQEEIFRTAPGAYKNHLLDHTLVESNFYGQIQATAAKGGIDFDPGKMDLSTRDPGEGIAFKTDPAMLAQWQDVPGFVPVIVGIAPMDDLRNFLGIPAETLLK